MYGFISEIINQLPAVPVLQVVWVDGGNSKHLGFLDRVPWLVLRVRNPRTKGHYTTRGRGVSNHQGT